MPRPPEREACAQAPAPRIDVVPPPANNPGAALWPLGVAAIGVLVRLGLPAAGLEEALPMKKAFAMWGWSSGHLTLDPGTAGWPSLSFYVHLLLQHLQYGLGRLTGTFADRNDFFVAAWPDLALVGGVARALSVAAAGGVIWLGARLGQRLAGRTGALLSGLLLAFSPLLVEYSRLITPDILVALFAALAVTRIVAIQERGRLSDYLWAGVWIGLGVSSKYTPVLLLPAMLVAHRLGRNRVDPSRRPSFMDRRPWLGVLAASLSFAATSPYLFLDLPTLARDVGIQNVHMTRAHFGQEGLGPGYYLRVLATGLGWTGLVACIAGLAWGSVKSRGPWLVLAACVVPYYLGLSVLATRFPRYLLPLLMPLAVGASGVLHHMAKASWPAGGTARTALASLVIALALAPAAIQTIGQRNAKTRPATQHLADRFLREAAGEGEPHIAAEPTLTRSAAQRVDELDPGFVARLSPGQRARLLAGSSYQIDFIPMSTVLPEQTAIYYDLRHYTPYHFIVVSQSRRDRYLADAARFPAHVRFYRDLDGYASLVWRSGPDQGAVGPEIRIYHLSPESAAALVRDRGALDVDRVLATAGALHLPTFTRFVEGVARAALARREWSMAEDYYRLLSRVAVQAGFSAEERVSLDRRIADLRSRSAATGTRGRSAP